MEKQIRFCPKCTWTKEMLEKEQMKLQDYIANIPQEDKVSDQEYEKRLMLCDRCSELRGGLCGQCGCYVAVRAVRKTGYCPHVRARW
ncbi:MAG: DUF6171 family protein [Roseburia sp.]|nr:DUF6171 family protein [Roseburia sp.]